MDELSSVDCGSAWVDSESLSRGVLHQMLAKLGVRLAGTLRTPNCVASNGKRSKVRFTLGHNGLLPRLDGRIFSADDVPHPKPAPDLFRRAARSLRAAPLRTVVVELAAFLQACPSLVPDSA